jgi:hypothetical protein
MLLSHRVDRVSAGQRLAKSRLIAKSPRSQTGSSDLQVAVQVDCFVDRAVLRLTDTPF